MLKKFGILGALSELLEPHLFGRTGALKFGTIGVHHVGHCVTTGFPVAGKISLLNPSNDRIFTLINIKTRFNKTSTGLCECRLTVLYDTILYYTKLYYTVLYDIANLASV